MMDIKLYQGTRLSLMGPFIYQIGAQNQVWSYINMFSHLKKGGRVLMGISFFFFLSVVFKKPQDLNYIYLIFPYMQIILCTFTV